MDHGVGEGGPQVVVFVVQTAQPLQLLRTPDPALAPSSEVDAPRHVVGPHGVQLTLVSEPIEPVGAQRLEHREAHGAAAGLGPQQ